MADRKREMSGFDLLRLEREFREALVGGNFDKAYQPSRDEVLLRFRSPEQGRFDVAVGLGRYLTRTTRSRDNPKHPPEFSKQLRNHLAGGKVLGVRQQAFDRILVFEVGKREGEFQLVVESFHDGNAILVLDGEVVLPLVHREWSDRVIRPNAEWRFPPSEIDPRSVAEPAYIDALRGSDADLLRTLSSVGNLGPVWAEEVCLRSGIGPERDIDDLSSDELVDVTRVVMDLVDEVREDPDPRLVRDEDGEPVNATPVPMRIHEDLEREPVETLSQALDQIFGPHAEEEIEDHDRLDEVDELRREYERRVEMLEEQVEGFTEKETTSKEHADVLYANYSDVEAVLEECQALFEEEGWGPIFERDIEHGQVRLARPKPENDELRLAVPDADGEVHEIDVDLEQGVDANAKRLYEASKTAREKREGARDALEEARRTLQEVEERGDEIVEELKRERAAPEPTKRFWFERFRWSLASTGNLMLAGRDAKSNEKVVKKHLEDGDRYVHANFTGAPSVVLKADDDGEIPQQAIDEAAQFAVAYSGAWQDRLGEAEAYWVTPPQVTKTPESGEYLPTGSFVIRGDRSYLRAPVKAAVGDTRVEGHYKVMGGPADAVTERCDRYALIEPGRTDPGDLASVLSPVFDVPVEEIQSVLPPGSLRVVRSSGIDESVFDEVDT
jgi:predicted ribosome quality control (RQC) complex YloA/Tae2 family protein